jgi:hypothetical protein
MYYGRIHVASQPSLHDFWIPRICVLEIHYCIFQSPCSTGFRLRTWFTLWKFVKNSSCGENEWTRRNRPPAMMIMTRQTKIEREILHATCAATRGLYGLSTQLRGTIWILSFYQVSRVVTSMRRLGGLFWRSGCTSPSPGLSRERWDVRCASTQNFFRLRRSL